MLRFAQHDIDGIGRTCDTGADGVLSTFSLRLYRAEIFVLLEIKVLPQESLKNHNILGVPIAARVLYPFFGVLLSPIIASAAMTLSSVSVISNALRLNRLAL